jgi:hypothetical protein
MVAYHTRIDLCVCPYRIAFGNRAQLTVLKDSRKQHLQCWVLLAYLVKYLIFLSIFQVTLKARVYV